MFTRARAERTFPSEMSQEPRGETGPKECDWRHAPEARGGFWEFWRKSVELRFRSGRGRTDLCAAGTAQSWELDSEREGSAFWARWGGTNLRATGAARDEGRWKSQNRKNVYLSPYVEESLNSTVIKCFVPELRSRKCFSCFGIPMFYVYMLWTSYVRFTYPYHGYDTYHQHYI